MCACLAVGLVACDEDKRTSRTISSALTSFPDFLDPALACDGNAWQALWVVYTPLLTYAHAEGAAGSELVPGVAEALPQISSDGKTYRLKLRDGVKFSDGRAVKASDFKHTVKRILELGSVGTPYFQQIAGAEEYLAAGNARGDISGIDTDDRSGTITIRLTSPTARSRTSWRWTSAASSRVTRRLRTRRGARRRASAPSSSPTCA